MLPPIENVPWDKLESWYGKTTEIPIQIQKLRECPTENIAIRACDFLSKELEHQDGICQAAAFATPYLIELLNEPCEIVINRVLGVLSLCFHGAMFGSNESGFRVGVDTIEDPEQYRERKSNFSDDENLSQEEMFAWAVLIYSDIRNARGLIEELANKQEPRFAEVPNTAKEFLPKIDDYWVELEKKYQAFSDAFKGISKKENEHDKDELAESIEEQDGDFFLSFGSVFEQPFDEPTDEKLIDFIADFTEKFNQDTVLAYKECAYWDGFSDEERRVNMTAFKECFAFGNFHGGKIGSIKTLPFSKWPSQKKHSPYISFQFFETAMTPREVLEIEVFFEPKSGDASSYKNASMKAFHYVFEVDGQLFIGTAKDVA